MTTESSSSSTVAVASEDDLAWYLTDAKHWWPAILQEVDPDSITDPFSLSPEDKTELMIAELRETCVYRVTLLGRRSDGDATPNDVLLLSPPSKQERIRQPMMDYDVYNKFVVKKDQQDQVFGVELAADYRRACAIGADIVLKYRKKRGYVNPLTAAAAHPPLPPPENEIRRVSVAPETAFKMQQPKILAVAAAVPAETEKTADAIVSEFSVTTDDDTTQKAAADGSPLAAAAEAAATLTMDQEIKSHDKWEVAWDKLDWAGWMIVDGVYVRPGKKYYVGNADLVDGVDYFTTLEGVQEFVRREYNWTGPRQARKPPQLVYASAPVERKLFSTPPDQKTVPQDPGKPLLSSVVKPAQKSVAKSAKKKSRSSKSAGPKAKSQSKRTMATVVQASTKKSLARKKSSYVSKMQAALSSHSAWWFQKPVPSSHHVWNILLKLGYTSIGESFELPAGVYSKKSESPVFASLSGLRKFLCKFGIPKYSQRLLSKKEATKLHRWVIFANVPVSGNDSAKTLKNVIVPTNKTQLAMLLADNGFSLMDGKVWAPNVVHGKRDEAFVFDINTDHDKIRSYVRDGWSLDSTAHSMTNIDDAKESASPIRSPPPAKYSQRVTDEKHLALRFWAISTGDVPLPEFDASKAPRTAVQIRLLERLEDEVTEDVMAASDCSAASSVQESIEEEHSISPPPKEEKKRLSLEKKKQKNAVQLPWWQETHLLSSDDAWNILERLGYSNENGTRFMLPLAVHESSSGKNQLMFQSLTGLRKFLCKFGVPHFDPDLISESDARDLDRWIKFANVPVDSRQSVSVLKKVSKPSHRDHLRSLIIRNGFTTVDGKYWAPGYKHFMKDKSLIFDEWEMSEGNDGKSRLKRFIRSAWTLDSKVLYLEKTPEKPPRSKYGSVDDDMHLQLRVWAAATSEALPPFEGLPTQNVEIKLMQMIPDEDLLRESESLEGTAEPILKATGDVRSTQPSVEETMPTQTATERVPTETRRVVKSARRQLDDVTPTKSTETPKRHKSLPWYYHEDISYLLDDWSLLQDAGWTFSSTSYFHSMWPEMRFDELAQLRQHMCTHGIPDTETTRSKLGPVMFDRLVKWIRFAHVPIFPNYFKKTIQGLEPLTDADALRVLVNSFGFKVDGDRVFLPGVDHEIEPIHGIEYVNKEEVASWLRSRASWASGGDACTRRGRQKMDNQMEALRLRLRIWAAAKDEPLPILVEAPQEHVEAVSTNVEEFEKADNSQDYALPVAEGDMMVEEADAHHDADDEADKASVNENAPMELAELDGTDEVEIFGTYDIAGEDPKAQDDESMKEDCASVNEDVPMEVEEAGNIRSNGFKVAECVLSIEMTMEFNNDEVEETEDTSVQEAFEQDDSSIEFDVAVEDPADCNPFNESARCTSNIRRNSFGSRQKLWCQDPAVDSLARLSTQPSYDDDEADARESDGVESVECVSVRRSRAQTLDDDDDDDDDDEISVCSSIAYEVGDEDDDMLLTQGA